MTTLDRISWLAERRQGVGASDVAAISGVSPWGSPWSVWADKVGLTPLDDDDAASPAMRFGRDLEPLIARWFAEETGLAIAGEQTMVHHADNPRWFATVDGFVLDSPESALPDALGTFESKYTSDRAWAELPTHYALQVQWQLACSGLSAAWVGAMHLPFGRPDFRVYHVERDETLISQLLGVVEAFWLDHVVTGVAPLVDEHRATAAAIDAAWGRLATARVPTVPFDAHEPVVNELAELRALRRRVARHLDRVETEVKGIFGEAARELDEHDLPAPSEGTIGGQLVVSWRHLDVDAGVDAERVRREHGSSFDKPRRHERRLIVHERRL